MWKSLKKKVDAQVVEYLLLLRSVPPLAVSLFAICLILMNFLANKELLHIGNLVLDCGFTLSWMTFLLMDMFCKRFGPKAAVQISLTGIMINLAVTLLFWLVSLAPGHWGGYYDCLEAGEAVAGTVDSSLNATLGGSWYVVFGSALATFVSSAVNSFVNWTVARCLSKDNFTSFALRSYISTAAGQFVDNFVFAIVVSHVLFGWTWTQVLVCASVAALFELSCEIVTSPLGYRLVRLWETVGIGEAYIRHQRHNELKDN